MMIKKLGKWVIAVIALIMIYYLSVYNPYVLNVINIFCLISGLYILTYPGAFSKTDPETFESFQHELNQKLKGHEKLLAARKEELLADYRGQFIFNTYVIGVPILLTFCLVLYGLTVSKQIWYEYLLIFFILIFLILHENNTLKYIPSSRYNRTRLKFFIKELQNKENSHDKPNMIVNNIELNQSEIKNDFSQVLIDNRANIINNSSTNISIDYTDIVYENNVNLINNKSSQTINNLQTNIDNRVINNDNRVFKNNINSVIERSETYTYKLNIESKFWNYILIDNGEKDIQLKYNKLIEIIENLNNTLFKKDNELFFRIIDNKVHFLKASHGKLLAEFTKYLILEGVLDKNIKNKGYRDHLLDIFEVSISEPFKHFQDALWNKIDRRNIIFYTLV